jgi:hypothetical protein
MPKIIFSYKFLLLFNYFMISTSLSRAFDIFQQILAPIAHNVQVVYDVFAAAIKGNA